MIFCDVGQGDAAYIRFPDGRDMVVDGGPNNSILNCLGRHMPFWDRTIDLVALSHPQADHMNGLVAVTERYSIGHMLRSAVSNTSEGFTQFEKHVAKKNIPVTYMSSGDVITIGDTSLSFLWPSSQQIAKASAASMAHQQTAKTPTDERVLGAQTGDLNDYSLVFGLRYGSFDVLFPGDADSHVEGSYTGAPLADKVVEVLKVPHHGSKTGMTDEFIDWVHPQLSVISVGKNSYGHPSAQALEMLRRVGSKVYRTDKSGDIEIISDGVLWNIKTSLTSSTK